MLPMEKSITFTGACANEIIPLINRLFAYKAKEGRHVSNLNLIGNLIHDYNDFNRIHMKINVDYTLQESQPVQ
jgi:hypothetical protein